MAKHITIDTTIKGLTVKDKPYRYTVCNNLYLVINPNNTKYWRWDYQHNNKRSTLAIGIYPETSLFQAVISANQAQQQLNQGFDPALLRKAEKRLADGGSKHGEAMTFEKVARQYGLIHIKGFDDEFDRTKRMLERSIFPYWGIG